MIILSNFSDFSMGHPLQSEKVDVKKFFTMKFCLKNMQPNRLRMGSFPDLVIFIGK
jgi:hypothetical protein